MLNHIIDEFSRKQMHEIENHVEAAFQKHFGISIKDVDLREIEHIIIEGDPIESYRYKGETFLYMQKAPGDIDFSIEPTGIKYTMTMKFLEV